MASSFNETIAKDLKSYNGVYFLVLVDLATRYCTATMICNKMHAIVIKGIFLSWAAIFGTPKKILSDNGGEFSNGWKKKKKKPSHLGEMVFARG